MWVLGGQELCKRGSGLCRGYVLAVGVGLTGVPVLCAVVVVTGGLMSGVGLTGLGGVSGLSGCKLESTL